MKTTIACIGFILFSTIGFAKNKINVNSKIKNVTVFLNGAQISREADISINRGVTEYVFDNLTKGININSIQVSGKGSFIILDTKHKVIQPDYSNPNSYLPESVSKLLVQINDSLEEVKYDIEESKINKQALETEKQFLVSNKAMANDSVPELKGAFQFFREKINDINAKLIQNKKSEDKLQKRLNGLNERLNKLNQEIASKYSNSYLQPNNVVIVTIQSELASNGKLILNYMDNNASWNPNYDIRSNQINDSILLTYKANIVQSTGEDWDNVMIKLSTNNPYKNKIKPTLPTWFVRYYHPYSTKKSELLSGAVMSRVEEAPSAYDGDFFEQKDKISDAEFTGMYTTMTENFTNIEFDIAIPYSIPSDNEKHMIAVKEDKLYVDYNYFIVPKLDKSAFLVASIKGFESLNLLPASANVYFGGTYIGQTMINPSVTGDSLSIDLGKDERITATRTALKIDEKESFLGNDKVKNYGYTIALRNNLSTSIPITIEDQIPVSHQKEITVSLKQKDNATFNENNGILTWKVKLEPKTSKQFTFKFEIKHPKDQQLTL